MSAIFGLRHLDRRPVDPQAVSRASQVLAHRGDGLGIWTGESVALLQRSLHPIPSELPQTAATSHPTVLAADVRLDNRDELIAKLGLRAESGWVSDEDLILRGFRRWGERCVEHLLGDFAFALWDGPNRTMFCARDHFGVRPLYYHFAANRGFACATELRALLSLPDVPREVEEVAVANYLERMADDPALTFFRHIHRLPPAHALAVNAEGELSLRRYWMPDGGREIRLRSDAEYAEAYLEQFSEAVRCRLRSAYPVGATLSGGLDSSSIVAVMRGASGGDLVPTFSAVFDGVPESDERSYIQAVASQGGLDPCFVRADLISPLADLDGMFDCEEQPFDAPNFFVHWNLYRAARQAGVGVILDGDGGDITVSHGIARLAELLGTGRLPTLRRELRGLSQNLGRSPLALFTRHALRPFVPAWLRRLRHRSRGGDAPEWFGGTMLSAEFARRIGPRIGEAAGRLHDAPPPRTARQAHHAELMGDLIASELELFNKGAAWMGLESRHPFFDRRLVEFCLGLPSEQKLHGGRTRVVARRAMEGLLPESVLRRTDKGDFTPNFVRSMRARAEVAGRMIFRDDAASLLSPYADLAGLRDAHVRLSSPQATLTDAYRLWKAATLAHWLGNIGAGNRT